MKKQLQIMAVSFASIFSVTSAYAGMIEAKNGDTVYVTHGDNYDQSRGGGEFIITGDNYNYIGFCLEYNEIIPINKYYTLADPYGVTDFAINGGTDLEDGYANEDNLSRATKWLANEYTNNYSGLYAAYKNKLAGGTYTSDEFAYAVQYAIWYFEDEATVASTMANLIVANEYATDGGLLFAKATDATYLSSVKVLNIVEQVGETYVLRQSQVVAPAPEPATMLLFGTGLTGLLGVMRARRNKGKLG